MTGIQYSAEKSNVKLVFKDIYDKPIAVKADREAIQKVISNLLVNSIKYSQPLGETKVSFYDMDENILSAIVGLDESIPLLLVKPFDRSGIHRRRSFGKAWSRKAP
jgi:two-component system phosphate regulon sensor histidine kinase PhoR